MVKVTRSCSDYFSINEKACLSTPSSISTGWHPLLIESIWAWLCLTYYSQMIIWLTRSYTNYLLHGIWARCWISNIWDHWWIDFLLATSIAICSLISTHDFSISWHSHSFMAWALVHRFLLLMRILQFNTSKPLLVSLLPVYKWGSSMPIFVVA